LIIRRNRLIIQDSRCNVERRIDLGITAGSDGFHIVGGKITGDSFAMQNIDGLVIGNEGNGVSRLVKEKCDFVASIPMKGDIDSLNASVAAGVMAFEIVRQRMV